MGKRFTDTNTFDDPWFRKLSLVHKCLWKYLLEKCDAAGVWKEDLDLAAFQIGGKLDRRTSLVAMSGRVTPHDGYWVINGFIPFQYGTLSETCPPHRKVLSLIDGYRNKGIEVPQEKVIRVVVPDPVLLETPKTKPAAPKPKPVDRFEEFWAMVPTKVGKGAARVSWKKAIANGATQDRIIAGVPSYVAYEKIRKAQGGDYRPLHPSTWLNQERWEDEIERPTKPGVYRSKAVESIPPTPADFVTWFRSTIKGFGGADPAKMSDDQIRDKWEEKDWRDAYKKAAA